jgi:DNA mismatch endonuclease, patch repair protein
MADVATRNTRPELMLRRELHSRGLRYRVNSQPIPGLRTRADLVFAGPRVAVYVDGCFWHSCPDHGVLPKANRAFWREKLATNVERDRRTDTLLTAAGWASVRVWEHEDVVSAADHIAEILLARTARPSESPHRRLNP